MRCLRFIFIVLIGIPYVSAEIIQILHVNDTHSHFAHALHNPERGGYARLKAMIDNYKREAKQQGIKTLVVHAGDFMEGHLFYMVDRGRQSWKLHNLMGYDVAVIGNHDYMMGIRELNKLLKEYPPTFAFLGANFDIPGYYEYINKHIHSHHTMKIDKTRIGFLGLTSDDDYYKSQVPRPEYLTNPYKTARKYLRRMRKLDAVIALTHLGLEEDKKLIKETSGIDLIIGGHSHDALNKPTFEIDKKGKKVPIVQAGYAGEFLGRLLINVGKNKTVKILDYQLLPVASPLFDPSIEAIVLESYEKLNASYGKDFLWETIGYSLLPPLSKEAHIKWSYFVTESIREAANAQISLHSPDIIGTNYPVAGPITRYDLHNGHPRFLNLNHTMGSSVYKTVIRGMWIDLFLKYLSKLNASIMVTGPQLKWERNPDNGTLKIIDIKEGKSIDYNKYYTVAFPGIIVESISKILGEEMAFVFTRKYRSDISVVQAVEEKIRRHGGTLANEDLESIHSKTLDKAYIPREIWPIK